MIPNGHTVTQKRTYHQTHYTSGGPAHNPKPANSSSMFTQNEPTDLINSRTYGNI